MTNREFFLKRARVEFPVTKAVLQALPEDRLDYKPDERSNSAQQIAWILANELQSNVDAAVQYRTEWKSAPPPPIAEIIKRFDQWSNELTDLVSKLDDTGWERTAQFYYEGKLVSEHPLGEFLWLTLYDSIHHRGQLSAYLRPMGGKVPAIYGPSADDRGTGAWK
jgi:uncharacterized damage-inducible protein DinB